MNERRFVIQEIHTPHQVVYPDMVAVSESELKRRFIEATQTIQINPDTGEMHNWHEVLSVLLHGEGKEVENE